LTTTAAPLAHLPATAAPPISVVPTATAIMLSSITVVFAMRTRRCTSLEISVLLAAVSSPFVLIALVAGLLR